jgi:hypothetical protein
MMRTVRTPLLLLLSIGSSPLLAQTLPEVRLHYQERPPYYESQASGAPRGLVLAPLQQALRVSGLPHRYESTPALRQLELIEQGDALVCGVGWFHNPERAARGRFSKPLYQDRPLVALHSSRLSWVPPRSMAEALADGKARLIVKAGYSYGPVFDRLLQGRQPPPLSITNEMPTATRMIVGDRADWTPMAPEEAEPEAAANPGLRLLPFSDAPQGNRRHLYCNKAVPEAWLARLDAALPPLAQR